MATQEYFLPDRQPQPNARLLGAREEVDEQTGEVTYKVKANGQDIGTVDVEILNRVDPGKYTGTSSISHPIVGREAFISGADSDILVKSGDLDLATGAIARLVKKRYPDIDKFTDYEGQEIRLD